MNKRVAQVSAIVAAVLVVGLVTVLLAANTEPGAGPRTTAAPTITQTSRTTSAPPRPTLTVDSGCRIGQGPKRLADVPRRVTDRVTKAWERIEKWLAAKAPATAATLAPPATAERIAEMQRQIGVPIPAELAASLLRHDGAGKDMRAGFKLPSSYLPISVEWITSEAKMMCEVLTGIGIDGNVGSWWHGQVVPFAADGGGGNLLLDQRPGRNGRLGEHDEESEMYFDGYPPTLTELLEVTATSLETGGIVLKNYRPKVEDGVLHWGFI